jgi:hypothetical protein
LKAATLEAAFSLYFEVRRILEKPLAERRLFFAESVFEQVIANPVSYSRFRESLKSGGAEQVITVHSGHHEAILQVAPLVLGDRTTKELSSEVDPMVRDKVYTLLKSLAVRFLNVGNS